MIQSQLKNELSLRLTQLNPLDIFYYLFIYLLRNKSIQNSSST